MHDFATNELIELYLDHVRNTKYFAEQYDRFSNEYLSGGEDELVSAAEYYLRMKYNGESKKDLLEFARKKYNGCLPTSVFLFDLLSNETETPNGYSNWLVDIFKNRKLPQENIERHLDEILAMN